MSAGTPSGALLARVAALAVVVVFLQTGIVSELPILGVAIDLTPLVVAFVGLQSGAVAGAVTGFAIGLLVDLTLVQTLGLTSLIFTVIGYGAGRLRELRDPQAALTPLLVGAAAAAASAVGYSVMEFMLGVDAPVSFELLRQIVVGVVLDTLVALPVWVAGAPLAAADSPRRPAAPSPSRLHDGRSEPLVTRMSPLERVRTPEPRVPPPGSSQLGLRVAVLGGVALVMFGIIFFRLWYLQILTGEQYVAQAEKNTRRELTIAAPRGQIVGREGSVLVTSKRTNAVQIVPWELPPAGRRRRELYRRLGRLLEMRPRTIVEIQEKGEKEVPYAPVTIKTNAGRGVLTVLGERQNEYPGVTQEQVSVREYPYEDMAAQVFGYVSQVTKEEEEPRNPQHANFKGVKAGTIVGQQGLEYQYDRYLRGTPGAQQVEINSENQRAADQTARDQAARRLHAAADARPAPPAGGRNRAAQGHGTRSRPRQPR